MNKVTKELLVEAPHDPVLQQDLEFIATENFPYENLANKAILVTGATGYIGSVLIKALLCVARTHKLTFQIIAQVRSLEKAQRIFGEQFESPLLTFVQGDVANPLVINLRKIDYVFHTASVTASKEMIEYPVETIMTSVEGLRNILELAREKEASCVVYLSSMEVYGKINSEKGQLTTERDLGYIDLSNVRSSYPESKRLCELLCVSYAKEHDLDCRIARLAQVFGAGVNTNDNRVFAQFARSVINKQDIVLHTEGTSEGNYCYISDTITGLLAIAFYGQEAEAYNVANENNHSTIRDMATLVADELAEGTISVVVDIPVDSKNFGYAAETHMQLSSEKLRSLGWKPNVGLVETYGRLIESLCCRR